MSSTLHVGGCPPASEARIGWLDLTRTGSQQRQAWMSEKRRHALVRPLHGVPDAPPISAPRNRSRRSRPGSAANRNCIPRAGCAAGRWLPPGPHTRHGDLSRLPSSALASGDAAESHWSRNGPSEWVNVSQRRKQRITSAGHRPTRLQGVASAGRESAYEERGIVKSAGSKTSRITVRSLTPQK